MDHRQYIEQYLSADADGELSSPERQAVSAHLADCPDCRQMLGAERELKTLLKARIPVLAAPPELRQRIIADLDRETARRPRVARRPLWVGSLSALAAAAAVTVVILIRGLGQAPPNSTFDSAVKDYYSSQQSFASTAGLNSLPQLAVALAGEFGYPWVWDFKPLGISLAGARIEHLPNGKAIAYSLYKGSRGSILCINFRELAYQMPPGGETIHGVRFYKYKHLSIGVVRYATVYCLIVSRLTPKEMAPALALGLPNRVS